MDHKFLKSYNKELMKMEMLKHEKIFREQVHELHHLYRVQKLLMSNMERHDQASNVQVVADSNYNRGVGLIDESEIQLTLGPSVYNYQYQHQHQHQHQKRLNSGQSLTKKEDFTWNFTPSTKNNARQVNLGEEHLRQDRMEKHLPWLFQPLSLKLT